MGGCGISHLVRKFMVTTPPKWSLLFSLSCQDVEVVASGSKEEGDLIAVPQERMGRVEGRGVGDWQSGTQQQQQLSETGEGEEEQARKGRKEKS